MCVLEVSILTLLLQFSFYQILELFRQCGISFHFTDRQIEHCTFHIFNYRHFVPLPLYKYLSTENDTTTAYDFARGQKSVDTITSLSMNFYRHQIIFEVMFPILMLIYI